MMLLTKEILKKTPALYETDGKPKDQVKIQAKFFNPVGPHTWYITELDPEDRMAYGFVNLGDDMCAELGYISIDELERLKLPLGLTIERDRNFRATLAEVMNFEKR